VDCHTGGSSAAGRSAASCAGSPRPHPPGRQRGVSTSSMRTSQRPPWARASSQLASAATSEPACSGPGGRRRKAAAVGGRGSPRPAHDQAAAGPCRSSRARRVAGCPAAAATTAGPPRRRPARLRSAAPGVVQGHAGACAAPALLHQAAGSRCARASGSGTKPQPRPRSSASSLARMLGTVSTSCPGSRFTVTRRQALRRIGHGHRAVVHQLRRSAGRCPAASGWCGATRRRRPSRPAAAARCRRRVGVRRRNADGQVGLAADQRLPGAGQHLAAQAQARGRVPCPGSLAVGPRAARRRPRTSSKHRRGEDVVHAIVSSLSQPWPRAHAVGHGVHLLQQAAALVQQFLPAAVSWAWRELRSNSSTSSASSSWRTL
jgi:hypothetical protein